VHTRLLCSCINTPTGALWTCISIRAWEDGIYSRNVRIRNDIIEPHDYRIDKKLQNK